MLVFYLSVCVTQQLSNGPLDRRKMTTVDVNGRVVVSSVDSNTVLTLDVLNDELCQADKHLSSTSSYYDSSADPFISSLPAGQSLLGKFFIVDIM